MKENIISNKLLFIENFLLENGIIKIKCGHKEKEIYIQKDPSIDNYYQYFCLFNK